MVRETVSSGIPSLDKIIEGGFNEGDLIVLAGQPGSGKSTLATQFIYNGATRSGHPAVYVTFVESAEKLRRDMLNFNWDLATLEKDRKVAIVDLIQTISEKGVDEILESVLDTVQSLKAKRLVIDSLSAMMTYISTKSEARSFMNLMNRLLQKSKCTTLAILEIPWGKREVGTGFEEFVGDGLVILESSVERFMIKRRLCIPKLRGINHALECYDFYITPEGIRVSPIPVAKQ